MVVLTEACPALITFILYRLLLETTVSFAQV